MGRGGAVRPHRGHDPAPRDPGVLTEVLDQLQRASRRAADPALVTALALVDDPWAEAAAADEARRLCGIEAEGRRLALLTCGPSASDLARGAAMVFGGGFTEGVGVGLPSDPPGAQAPFAGFRLLAGGSGASGVIDDEVRRAVGALYAGLAPHDRLVVVSATAVEGSPQDGLELDGLVPGVFARADERGGPELLRVHIGPDPDAAPAPDGRTRVRTVDPGVAAVEAIRAEARTLGFGVEVLARDFRGDPTAAGRAMARVGGAILDGVAPLRPPACALVTGRLDGGRGRHDQVRDAAKGVLAGRDDVRVEAWSCGPLGPDVVVALVRP